MAYNLNNLKLLNFFTQENDKKLLDKLVSYIQEKNDEELTKEELLKSSSKSTLTKEILNLINWEEYKKLSIPLESLRVIHLTDKQLSKIKEEYKDLKDLFVNASNLEKIKGLNEKTINSIKDFLPEIVDQVWVLEGRIYRLIKSNNRMTREEIISQFSRFKPENINKILDEAQGLWKNENNYFFVEEAKESANEEIKSKGEIKSETNKCATLDSSGKIDIIVNAINKIHNFTKQDVQITNLINFVRKEISIKKYDFENNDEYWTLFLGKLTNKINPPLFVVDTENLTIKLLSENISHAKEALLKEEREIAKKKAEEEANKLKIVENKVIEVKKQEIVTTEEKNENDIIEIKDEVKISKTTKNKKKQVSEIKNKLLVLSLPQFQDMELVTVTTTLERAQSFDEIVFFNPNKELNSVNGQHNIVKLDLVNEINLDEFSAIFIPGGKGATHLRSDLESINVIKDFQEKNKWIFAICDAPNALFDHEIITGEEYTAYPNIKQKYGLNYQRKANVVVHNKFITGRSASTSIEFALEIIKQIQGQEKAEEVNSALNGF